MSVMKKGSGMNRRKWKERGFLLSVWIYPVVLFVLLYVYINFNSVILSFQKFDIETQSYRFLGFSNFKAFASNVFSDQLMRYTIRNSAVTFGIRMILELPMHILVAFFLYKKIYGAGIFKVILFLPSIISATIWVLLFKYMAEYGVPEIFSKLGLDSSINLLGNDNLAFGTVLFYSAWIGFAGGMLIFIGSMSRIPTSLVESAKLDGIGLFKEFYYITLPLIFPVISVYIITGIPSFFTNQLSLYVFFEDNAGYKTYTFGYYLFVQVIGKNGGQVNYPYAAAGGLLFTLIVAPLTIAVRVLLEHFGPSSEY